MRRRLEFMDDAFVSFDGTPDRGPLTALQVLSHRLSGNGLRLPTSGNFARRRGLPTGGTEHLRHGSSLCCRQAFEQNIDQFSRQFDAYLAKFAALFRQQQREMPFIA